MFDVRFMCGIGVYEMCVRVYRGGMRTLWNSELLVETSLWIFMIHFTFV